MLAKSLCAAFSVAVAARHLRCGVPDAGGPSRRENGPPG
jgi:hypothetical protein